MTASNSAQGNRKSLMKDNLRWSIYLLFLLVGLVVFPVTALAHPLDVYLQATYITVRPTAIIVELDLSPGVLVAPQILAQLDPDGDQQITEAEGQAYVTALLPNLLLQVDGQPLMLAVTKIDMPSYLTIQAGYGTIRVFTTATLAEGMTGTHQLIYQNNYASTGGPLGAAYQVNVLIDKETTITLGKQNREESQQRITMDFVVGAVAGATAAPVAAPVAHPAAATVAIASAMPAGAAKVLTYLYEPVRSPWVLLLALALATVLGGLHALTPGHGKTLVAAYLVGSRGTVKHAIFLGSIVTFTHTASVIVIGLLALFASQFVIPDVLIPLLEILSGLLVVYLGGRLIWQRWLAFRGGDHNHNHGHDHGDGHVHTHLPPAAGVSFSNLLTMGISGGLVPCPEALGIMVIAIGLNRILLGLGLIVSFSFGLAAVLIAIGLLLVRSRALVERFGGVSHRWSSALPLASAIIVTVLGIGIMVSGLATYLG